MVYNTGEIMVQTVEQVKLDLPETKNHLELIKYSLDLLNRQQLPIFGPDFNNLDWFTNRYQSRAQKKNPEYYSLKTMLNAVHNSEASFRQYPVDERNLKALARSIFTEQEWLRKDPTLAVVEGEFYIIGGRHRINAIAEVFAQYIRNEYKGVAWTDVDRQQAFEDSLEQNVRCEVLYLHSISDLLILIQADNESRTMRKAETAHMEAQALGADAESINSVSKAVLGHDLQPKDAVKIAGQNFVRRTDVDPSKLRPQTRQVIGERIAKYVLYGTDPDKKLSTKNDIKISSVEDFEHKMDKAWDILKETIEGEKIIALNARDISKKVAVRLGEEIQEEYEEEHKDDPVQEIFTATPKPRGRPSKLS